jgi:ElaB/YqjD/DUF883 family membrane-anchored ribosome-binding protein
MAPTTLQDRMTEIQGALDSLRSDLAQEADRSGGRLSHSLSHAAESLRRAAAPLGDLVQRNVGQAADSARDFAGHARDTIADFNADDAAGQIRNTLRRHPIASVLIALGIGAVVARMME